MNNDKKRFTFTVQQIAILGVLIAASLALSRVEIFIGPTMRISLGFMVYLFMVPYLLKIFCSCLFCVTKKIIANLTGPMIKFCGIRVAKSTDTGVWYSKFIQNVFITMFVSTVFKTTAERT